jgi:1,4-dihydroxy-2-naphthoate octaprenyltransferase
MKINPFDLFLKLSRPHFLLGILGQVFLGAGIAHYLGHRIDWGLFSLGLGWVFSLQLAVQYLIQYFDRSLQQMSNPPTPLSFYSGILGDGEDQLPRNIALGAASGMLTITTIFTLGMAQFDGLNPPLVIVMAVIFLAAISYALPVVNLAESGQGELLIAILIGVLVPGFSYLLQTGEADRLVILVTIPLAILLISVFLALEFPNYALSMKLQKHNLLLHLGWKSAMSIHDTFIIFSFLALGAGTFFGLPPRISLPAFLALPLGLLQIWQMRRIAAGGKPNWKTLTWNAVVIFGLMNYTLAISFWIR